MGVLILILTGTIGGYSAAIKLSRKLRFLEGYAQFIKVCQNEIRYTGRYLSDIIKNYNAEGIFSLYLDKCCNYISFGEPFPKSWEKAFSSIPCELSVSPRLTEIIINFGLGLGVNDVEGQMSHCQYNYELVQPYIQTVREEKNTKGKLYSILGVCLGIAVSLFLI